MKGHHNFFLSVRNYKILIFLTVLVGLCLIYFQNSGVYHNKYLPLPREAMEKVSYSLQLHKYIIDQYYDYRKDLKTSNLGSILFKRNDKNTLLVEKNRKFTVLIWRHWEWLKYRHIFRYSSTPHNPLEDCSVNNCEFTGNNRLLDKVDAVVVHLQKGVLPNIYNRTRTQRWIFLTDESPIHLFGNEKNRPNLSDLVNVFNWSMTYRTDADIPVPYGRTIPLEAPIFTETTNTNITKLIPNWKNKRRDVLASILMSNCGVPYRMKYLNKLKKHMKIDIHGKCSDSHLVNSCPGHFRADCKIISNYLFYFVLENSLCKEYITEKLFHQAYAKGAIPIIQGPPLEDCKRLLPPNSFLHLDEYRSPKKLANEIRNITSNEDNLLSYHLWRNHFQVINEHGYFGTKSYHYCRICEALNYNDETESVYDSVRINNFMDASKSCTRK
ncbi:alpha-(1,3)-fucosyltransferase 7 [Bombyx mori]|uniref:Fucosyltransferase n=1 Tax=Bombyx mori TaxID=7091 RepID=A0A8R2M3W6_BOMMO|nr:alpha-(1,3)-fucosyltransferase 7-like [Bombyx mori]